MPHTNNHGVHIHYKVEGVGSPIVLLHGLSGSLQSWYDRGYVDSLKKKHQLILVDARGHGASDKPHEIEAYELKRVVADIVAVLEDLNVSKARFVGYSMGGRIGFGVAKYASDYFNSFVIGGAHPYTLDPNVHDSYLQLFKKGMSAITTAMEKLSGMKMRPQRRALIETNDSDALAAFWSASQWPGLEDVLPTMTMPCLVYVGEVDPLYPGVKKCVKDMPNATFVSLPRLDHFEAIAKKHVILPYITNFFSTS